MKILRPNRKGLYFAIATYITLQTAKSMLLSKLNNIQSIGSFMRTSTGYKQQIQRVMLPSIQG